MGRLRQASEADELASGSSKGCCSTYGATISESSRPSKCAPIMPRRPLEGWRCSRLALSAPCGSVMSREREMPCCLK
eukprot:1511122-Prymnesium_polylepis.1